MTETADAGAAKDTPLAVLFDGDCPLCSREIAWYRGLDTRHAIAWIDVARCSAESLPPGVDRAEVLARFHAVLPDGRTVSGARAFISVWHGLPRLRWMARLASVPPVPAMLELGYRGFLRFRPQLQWLVRRG